MSPGSSGHRTVDDCGAPRIDLERISQLQVESPRRVKSFCQARDQGEKRAWRRATAEEQVSFSADRRENQELGDWGKMLSRLRALVKEAIPKSSRSGSGEAFRCGRTTD